MDSFAIKETVAGKTVDCNWFYRSGTYAGGKVETRTRTTETNGRTKVTTTEYETVNIRGTDGKIFSVVKDGTANIPQDTLITVFYYETKDKYCPMAFYVHDTERLNYLGQTEWKKAKSAALKRGLAASLWGSLMNGANYISSLGAAIATPFLIKLHLFDLNDYVMWGVGIAMLFVYVPLFSLVTDRLGGTIRADQPLEALLKQQMFAQAEKIEKGMTRHQQNSNELAFAGAGLAEGGIIDGAVGNTDNDGFKPMM
ncbi:hypothetical protein [Ferrimonas lipolytica]|uniref:Uncharacterized protein n=1 Tax=Ferrimonas lipolytica TaxID=2724191 RepID=A0A6H1UG99_9GAMM|nr:hypothetical protein [Ferrimonas lipolytica]QIZ77630.1 hypothetical protein HER31_12445 [Ferrimonas lipolytica]